MSLPTRRGRVVCRRTSRQRSGLKAPLAPWGHGACGASLPPCDTTILKNRQFAVYLVHGLSARPSHTAVLPKDSNPHAAAGAGPRAAGSATFARTVSRPDDSVLTNRTRIGPPRPLPSPSSLFGIVSLAVAPDPLAAADRASLHVAFVDMCPPDRYATVGATFLNSHVKFLSFLSSSRQPSSSSS